MSDYIILRVISRKFIDEDGKPVENKFGYFKGEIDNCVSTLKNREELEIAPEIGWFKDIEEPDEEIEY